MKIFDIPYHKSYFFFQNILVGVIERNVHRINNSVVEYTGN